MASAVYAPKLNLGSDAVVVLSTDGRNTNTKEMTHDQHIVQRTLYELLMIFKYAIGMAQTQNWDICNIS